jgi:hypothetical protein
MPGASRAASSCSRSKSNAWRWRWRAARIIIPRHGSNSLTLKARIIQLYFHAILKATKVEMQFVLGNLLPLLAIAIFLSSLPVLAAESRDDTAMRTLLHRPREVRQRSFNNLMMKRGPAADAIVNGVLVCCVSNVIYHPNQIKTPKYRASTLKSRLLVRQTSLAVDQAGRSVWSRSFAGVLHHLSATRAPIIRRHAFALVFFIKHRFDTKSMPYFSGPIRGQIRGDSALRPRFVHSNVLSEILCSCFSRNTEAYVTLFSSHVSPSLATWSNFLLSWITMANASAITSNAALSGFRTTNNFLTVQKKWSAHSKIFVDVLPGLFVRSSAIRVNLDFDRVRYISKRSFMMKLNFLNLVVHTSRPIYTIVCQARIYLFIALQSVETRTTRSRNNEVAQCHIPIPLSLAATSCGICYAVYFFCCPANAEIKDQWRFIELFGIKFLSSLAFNALLAFCLGLCCFLSYIFGPHPIAWLNPSVLFFRRCPIEPPRIPTRQNLPQAYRCKRHIPPKNQIAHSDGGSLVVSPNLDKSDARQLVSLTELVVAHSRSKFYALFGVPASFTNTMILLALFCSVTHAQSCSQGMLGLERSFLASTELPSGSMFFAGGKTGLMCLRA